MKKLIGIVVLLVTTATSHGASVGWFVNNLKTPPDSSVTLPVGNNVLLELYLSTDGVVDWTTSGTGSDTLADTGRLTAGGTMALTTVYVDGNAARAAATAAGTSPNLSMYAVVYYNDNAGVTVNGIADATSYYVTALTTKSISNIDSAAVNFTWAGTTGMTWTPVPEPTSMALFGLGAAVLGLRRRFKKKS